MREISETNWDLLFDIEDVLDKVVNNVEDELGPPLALKVLRNILNNPTGNK